MVRRGLGQELNSRSLILALVEPDPCVFEYAPPSSVTMQCVINLSFQFLKILNNMIEEAWKDPDVKIIKCKEFEDRNRLL